MRLKLIALVSGFLGAGAVQAATFDLPLTETDVLPGFGYRIDLSDIGLLSISSIELQDDPANTTTGRATGFDVDAILFDVDGDIATTDDQTAATSFQFTPGMSTDGSALNGSDGAGGIDEMRATLDAFDGTGGLNGTGYLSMGRDGILRASFDPGVTVGETLFLFTGEVGRSESLSRITVEGTAIPLPAGVWFMLTGFGLLGFWRLKFRAA
ncbi:MAG: hypothetical protein ACFB11_20395 [Paracoccaceae bacterium]